MQELRELALLLYVHVHTNALLIDLLGRFGEPTINSCKSKDFITLDKNNLNLYIVSTRGKVLVEQVHKVVNTNNY